MEERKNTTMVFEVDEQDESELSLEQLNEMDFPQYNLFVRKADLPGTVNMEQVLNNVDTLYGCTFVGIEHKLYIHLVSPNASAAKKLLADGIDLGATTPKVRVYNIFRHNSWVSNQL